MAYKYSIGCETMYCLFPSSFIPFYMECNLSQKQYHMPREELVTK